MADTTFIDYTQPAVNAAWLNDVNDNIYDTSTPPAGTFRASLSNTTDPTKGDALVPAKRTSIAAVASTVHHWIEGTVVSAAEVGFSTTATASDNASVLNTLMALSPARKVYVPAGTYQVADLDFTTSNPNIFGDGVESTKLVYTGTGVFVNAVKAVDAFLPRSPLYLEGISFNGVTKGAKTGISIKYRHDYVIRNCTFDNFSTAVRLDNAWLGLLENVTTTGCDIGWDLVGDINRVSFKSCGVTDFTQYGLIIKPGTFGCNALAFDNCDIEFGAGVCVRSETNDHISFNDCYLGDGCGGNVFEIVSGQMVVNGGFLLWGQDASFTNRLVEFVGISPFTDERSLSCVDAKVGCSTHGGPDSEKMVKGTGKIYIEKCGIATVPFWSGSAKVLVGNPLGSRPGTNALNSPQGNLFTSASTGPVTFTSTVDLTVGSLRTTCTLGGGGGDALYCHTAITSGGLRTFGAASVIVVYKSNANFGVNLSGGPFNLAPTLNIGGSILPNTGGQVRTMVIYNQNPPTAAYTTFEIYKLAPVIGDYIEVMEAYLFDERQAGALGTLYVGKNLYKPMG